MLLLLVICYLIAIKLDFMLLLSVVCYLIVINFTASSILSHLHCDGLFETKNNNNKGLVYCFLFIHMPFVPLIKCNLGKQHCPDTNFSYKN